MFVYSSVPDSNTMKLMLHREEELQGSKSVQRAFSLPFIDRREVNYQIQLRIVREFGLPDTTVKILQNSQSYYSNEGECNQKQFTNARRYHSPSKRRQSPPLCRRKLKNPPKPVYSSSSSTRMTPCFSREVNIYSVIYHKLVNITCLLYKQQSYTCTVIFPGW